ncbi:hypothetical protein ACP26L_07710 [Paenibacillus sp. S-38]|uniref:hypothetical protein n=1 Tax=Paenibacillus sp. S-38 TaxID=3416710 RepID=UPI003CF9F706
MILESIGSCPLADGIISEITIRTDQVVVKYKSWNDKDFDIVFNNSLGLNNYRAVGNVVSHIEILKDGKDQHMRHCQTLSERALESELVELKMYLFIEAWGTCSILEVYASDVVVLEN